ncbi:hypothetical protein HID58_060594 [Brassica napus]|uniref:Uncharacterized protein n=1 Tax=Brassica napus TaxID=3708 RepID=A0ABQ7ZWV4_BRANA|nr:hypothetical protein HID58_060594 [Brassica napus]
MRHLESSTVEFPSRENDVLALCTGMRPVVMMIDYGGKMHDLQDRFSKIASLLLSSSSNITTCMVEPSKESNLGMQLTSIQKLFSSTFPLHGSNNDTTTALDEANSSQPSLFIDLSCCLQDTKIWLLEYPVVYLFGTYHIEDAIYNLPTKSLRIFKVLVQRRANKVTTSDLQYHHGYFADINNNYEVWAEAFLERMSSRWEECKHIWICKFPNVILKQLFFKVRAGTVRSSTMLQSKAPTYESRAPVVSTDVC